MKIKKYKAPSMPEVMKQVRKDFGTDAVILQSRQIKSGGMLGLFKKNYIEVVAGYDPEPVQPVKKATVKKKLLHCKRRRLRKRQQMFLILKNWNRFINSWKRRTDSSSSG